MHAKVIAPDSVDVIDFPDMEIPNVCSMLFSTVFRAYLLRIVFVIVSFLLLQYNPEETVLVFPSEVHPSFLGPCAILQHYRTLVSRKNWTPRKLRRLS